MKRWGWTALLLALLLVAGTALAYDDNTAGVANLPQEVTTFLSTSRWAGWEVTGWVNPAGLHQEKMPVGAFVAVKHGATNDLLAFGWADNGWVYQWHNADALPQVEASIHLAEASEDGTAFASYYLVNEELQEHKCIWRYQKDGSWRLTWFATYDPLMFIQVDPDGLYLTNVGWVEGGETDEHVFGQVQCDLRYFSMRAFPTTVAAARRKLTNAPELPVGTLSAQKIKFTSGKKYKVYQGPGEAFGQAGGGKAAVSTNDWIQVFGREGDWIMIQYDITSDHMRIGWIPEKALPKKADVPELGFAPLSATVVSAADMTDDPLFSRSAISTLPYGLRVYCLATMGEWTYVESDCGGRVRGFVPTSAVQPGIIYSLDGYSTVDGGVGPSGGLMRLNDGGMGADIDVSGWAKDRVARLNGFNLYDAATGELLCTANSIADARFTGATDEAIRDTQSVLVCPVYQDVGEQPGEAVTVQW